MAALTDWTYDGVLASRDGSLHDPVWTGHAWECPQLLEIDGHHVLIVSVWSADVTHYVAAAVGEYAEGRFEARQWHRLTFGAHYAGTTFRDAKGAPCLLLWVRDVEDLDAGWAGAQSIPLRLGVADGRLTVAAHPVLDQHPVASVAGWTPVDGAELTAVSGSGRTLATLTGAGDHVVVRVGTGEPTELPVVADRVQVIVDGPILEVVTRHATYASGIDARGETVLLERPT
jgi:beta-fructofuranosidase